MKVMELPVIQKEPVRRFTTLQNGDVKPRVPNRADLVRIHGNNKTEPNVTDTTKGCAGGCFGCYAARSMGVLQNGIEFTKPVTQIVVPEVLQHDISVMVNGDKHLDWVRNGTLGDPSYDWGAAVAMADAAGRMGVRNVIISKFWELPTDEQLESLALSGAILHFSLIPGYEWAPHIMVGRRKDLNRVQSILSILLRYDKMTRPKGMKYSDSVCIRICSAKFDTTNPVGFLLNETQEFFFDFARDYKLRVLETPWKFEGNDPRNPFLVHEDMEPVISYTTGLPGRKKSAGMLLSADGFDKYKDWDHHVVACDTRCDVCPNQCGTVQKKPIHILGE